MHPYEHDDPGPSASESSGLNTDRPWAISSRAMYTGILLLMYVIWTHLAIDLATVAHSMLRIYFLPQRERCT